MMDSKRPEPMELSLVKQGIDESPPPPPAGTSLREWYAGLALSNSALMQGVPAADRPAEAVRIADELIRALVAPRLPSRESLAPITSSEMAAWDDHVARAADAKELRARPTVPSGQHHFKAAVDELRHERARLAEREANDRMTPSERLAHLAAVTAC